MSIARYQQILQYHMEHNEFVHIIETCKKFGWVPRELGNEIN